MGIGKLAKLFTVGLLCAPRVAYCSTNINHIFEDFYSETGIFDTDTIINNNVHFAIDDAYVVNNITIDNRGYVGGNINVCPDCVLFIHNSGVFDASLNLDTGAHITQVITDSNEITDIGLDDNFDILVCDGADVSFGAIMSAGINATKITFDDVVLRVDKDLIMPRRSLPDIELRGDVLVVLSSLDDALSGNAVLSNIQGDGVLNFHSDAVDEIHSLQGRVENGNVYVDLVRETDYVKIFHNNIGAFLNDVRGLYPDDPLLTAMDAAPDINSMYDVMSRSVRLHSINLMQPIRTSMAMRDMDIDPRDELGLGTHFMYSSDYYIYGTDASFGLNISDNWYMSGAFGVGYMEYMDDINIFAADVYNSRLNIGYDNGRVMHRVGAGLSIVKFDIGPVFDGHKTVYNPTGIALRLMYETGRQFNISRDILFTPIIGANSDFARVASANDTSVAGVFGFDAEIDGGYFVLDYDYALRVRANTNGDMSAAIGVRIFSHGDDMGGDVSIGVIRDEFATSYNVSTGLRIAF